MTYYGLLQAGCPGFAQGDSLIFKVMDGAGTATALGPTSSPLSSEYSQNGIISCAFPAVSMAEKAALALDYAHVPEIA